MRTMRNVVARPLFVAGGLSSLGTTSPAAVQRVFGSPPTAAMVIGGSDVIPVLRTAKAVRPLGQFGVFPFPTIGNGPVRVIGQANTVVMTADTPAARALVRYLATPQAAEIWAKRGDFLSPNRKLDPSVYPNLWMRTLGSTLASADVFRFSVAELVSPTFKETLDSRLAQFLRTPSRIEQIAQQLQAASVAA
jgi:ABC-type glycerol-3-phosphate transport system substrate-binding protein